MWSLGKLFTVDTTDMKEHVCVWMQAAGWLSSVGNSLVLGLSWSVSRLPTTAVQRDVAFCLLEKYVSHV